MLEKELSASRRSHRNSIVGFEINFGRYLVMGKRLLKEISEKDGGGLI